jgi:hypothetical protein
MKRFRDLFNRKEQTGPLTLVSGLPRSGTSMMMKMLEAGGLPPLTDAFRAADDDNPKGYYEFERAKKLREGDADWLPDAQGKAVKVISALLRHLPSNYRYNVIFLRRAMPEILASQKKMLVNRGEDPDKVSDEDMAQLYQKHLGQVTAWMAEQDFIDVLYLDYAAILNNPGPVPNQIARFLRQEMDTEAMLAIVDPDLYRQRAR